MEGFWMVMSGVAACITMSVGAFTWCKRKGRLAGVEQVCRLHWLETVLNGDSRAGGQGKSSPDSARQVR